MHRIVIYSEQYRSMYFKVAKRLDLKCSQHTCAHTHTHKGN